MLAGGGVIRGGVDRELSGCEGGNLVVGPTRCGENFFVAFLGVQVVQDAGLGAEIARFAVSPEYGRVTSLEWPCSWRAWDRLLSSVMRSSIKTNINISYNNRNATRWQAGGKIHTQCS